MARLTIRIDLGKQAAFGPGKAKLLETIEKKGSIRSAAAALGMSYRRAWLLVQDIEAIMGAPVLVAATGGAKGGGATLTSLGRAVLDRYRTIERVAAKSVAAELRGLTRMAKAKRHPKSARHRRGAVTPIKPSKRTGKEGP
jgi:molybdate transport system regulatory protein